MNINAPGRSAEAAATTGALDPFDGSLLVAVGGNLHERTGYARAWPTSEAMPTLTGTLDRALVTSITHDDRSQRARSALEPLATQTGWQEHALVLANRENGIPRPTANPIQTIVTQGGMYVVELPGGVARVVSAAAVGQQRVMVAAGVGPQLAALGVPHPSRRVVGQHERDAVMVCRVR